MKRPAGPQIDSRSRKSGNQRSLILGTSCDVSREDKISWQYCLRLESHKISSPVDFHHDLVISKSEYID